MDIKNKKILYLITKGNFGGAQRYVYDLATNMKKDEWDIVVAFGEGTELGARLNEKNIKTVKLENSKRNINFLNDLKLFGDVLNLIKDEKPDIIHLNSSKMGFVGALAVFVLKMYYIFYRFLSKSSSFSVRVVFTAHGWAFNEKRPNWQTKLLRIFQWLTLILSDHIIAVSEKVKIDISKWLFVQHKISVIHNGIKEFNTLDASNAREKLLQNHANKIWLGTISELHHNKGLDLLISASKNVINKHSNLIVVIIGGGEELGKLSRQIKKERLSDNIFLVGHVPNAKTYLKAFDVFTLCSRTEGLPYAILEAGITGLPVIASRVGGIPEIIQNQKNGVLVEKENLKDISSAILNLIANQNKRKEIGENLKQNIQMNFSLERMVGETLKVYF